tara:strand:+ start:9469 stop:9768 length:300 start_codon:yes stop_codon:yes gene_type:complete
MVAQIPDFIKQIRKDYNLTQNELAEKLGCNVMSIHAYESGKRTPSLSKLDKILELFPDTDIYKLIEIMNNPIPENRVTVNLLDQIDSLKRKINSLQNKN